MSEVIPHFYYTPFCEKRISFINWLLSTYYVPGGMLGAGTTEASDLLQWNEEGERAHKEGGGHFHPTEGFTGVLTLSSVLSDEWYQ